MLECNILPAKIDTILLPNMLVVRFEFHTMKLAISIVVLCIKVLLILTSLFSVRLAIILRKLACVVQPSLYRTVVELPPIGFLQRRK